MSINRIDCLTVESKKRIPFLIEFFPNLHNKIPFLKLLVDFTIKFNFLSFFSEKHDCSIYLKGWSGSKNIYEGNKTPKLEFLFADFLSKIDLEGYKCIVTLGGKGSNHCVATSFWGKKFNIPVIVVLEKQPASNYVNINYDLMKRYGAICVESDIFTEDILVKITNDYGKPYIIPQGGSNVVGIVGFLSESLSIFNQFIEMNNIPSTIIIPLGTGGSLTGLLIAKYIFLELCTQQKIKITEEKLALIKKIKIMGVLINNRPLEFYQQTIQKLFNEVKLYLSSFDNFFSCINCNLLEDIIFEMYFNHLPYGIPSPEVEEIILEAEDKEQLFLDPVYSGKAFYGMLKSLEKEKKSSVLFIYTFSGNSYKKN